MLTSPAESTLNLNGKENYPAIPTNLARLRGDKAKKLKGKEVSQEVPMEQAFDKLLVSRLFIAVGGRPLIPP